SRRITGRGVLSRSAAGESPRHETRARAEIQRERTAARGHPHSPVRLSADVSAADGTEENTGPVGADESCAGETGGSRHAPEAGFGRGAELDQCAIGGVSGADHRTQCTARFLRALETR